ncbi:hypothetical protein [Aeromonas sp. S9(2024)]|uniref:hypothetical protein n=1 Tax=Aeromonas sp. S9(2024) TaxID=3242882 RepID=UPI00352948D2
MDNICKHIVVAISLHGKSITEPRLRFLYSGLVSSNFFGKESKDYESVIKLLVGALLNRIVIDKDNILYNLFNPSIADFVISNYLVEFNYIDELLICLKTPESISNINSLKESGVVGKDFFINILESQLIRLSKLNDGNDIDSYKLRILSFGSSILSPQGIVLEYIQYLVKSALSSGPCSYGIDYFEFVNWAHSLGLIDANDVVFKKQLECWVCEYEKDMNEFIPISKLVSAVDINPSTLTENLKKQYIEHLSEWITRDIIEEGILSDVYDADTCTYSDISDYVKKRFSELVISFEEADVDAVCESCDFDDIVQSNINSSMHDEEQYEAYREQRYSMESSVDVINDIFERS